MSEIHAVGIVHFDLKPANVLMEMSGDGLCRCVICDFGFANFVNDAKANLVKGLKTPTSLGITARYAAPELFKKISNFEISSTNEEEKKIDVYAFGMTMFFMFSREQPWKNYSLEMIEKCVLDGERPVMPVVDPQVSEIIVKCWVQDPKERPSFSEIYNKLVP